MKHYFPKDKHAAKEFKKKRRLLKNKKAKSTKWCCFGTSDKKENLIEKQQLKVLEEQAYMDSKNFHRLFSFQQFHRMAQDLDKLRRLPEIKKIMSKHNMHFLDSDPDY